MSDVLGREKVSSHQPKGMVKKTGAILKNATSGAASMVKTQVLRQDRTTNVEYEARLETCRNCPGNHATFHADGSLHTCGSLFKSIAGEGDGTCGCILSKKARDAESDCPFGYWPTLESKPIEAAPEVPREKPSPILLPERELVVASSMHGRQADRAVRPQSSRSSLSRRRFMGRSIATVAGLGLAGKAWGTQTSYIAVQACGSGTGTDVECSLVAGRFGREGSTPGDIFKATDGECYELLSTVSTGSNPVTPDTWYQDCNSCCCGCYELRRCDGNESIYTNTDFSDHIFKAVKYDDKCYLVYSADSQDCSSATSVTVQKYPQLSDCLGDLVTGCNSYASTYTLTFPNNNVPNPASCCDVGPYTLTKDTGVCQWRQLDTTKDIFSLYFHECAGDIWRIVGVFNIKWEKQGGISSGPAGTYTCVSGCGPNETRVDIAVVS